MTNPVLREYRSSSERLAGTGSRSIRVQTAQSALDRDQRATGVSYMSRATRPTSVFDRSSQAAGTSPRTSSFAAYGRSPLLAPASTGGAVQLLRQCRLNLARP